jgi:protein-S-isoprenylcysteine O-methyltransferase Ste14
VKTFRHLQAILILPVTMIILVPILLVMLTRTFNPAFGLTMPVALLPVAGGVFLISAGVSLVIVTVRMFITIGQGTLAPWDPTEKLVARGIYRHTRNPMIVGVLCMLLGETLLTGSLAVFGWWLFAVVANLIYIPRSEEPGLIRRFGDDYRRYQANVPRWLPRRTPWNSE